ncbi:hypothetical protein RYX36_006015 [Vicia faba]
MVLKKSKHRIIFENLVQASLETLIIRVSWNVKDEIQRSKRVFDSIENPCEISLWNGLMAGYTKNYMYVEALGLFDKLMCYPYLKPNSYTYPSVLKACGGLCGVVFGQMVHTCLIKTGLMVDIIVRSSLVTTRANVYSDDEIRPLASLLAQTNAAEAFYISVKLGVERIGELLRRSIASSLSRYPNSKRLNTLLETVTEKFDEMISSFTHLEGEFSRMIQITKTHRSPENMEGVALRNDIGLLAKHSWIYTPNVERLSQPKTSLN